MLERDGHINMDDHSGREIKLFLRCLMSGGVPPWSQIVWKFEEEKPDKFKLEIEKRLLGIGLQASLR